jgi:anti-sigma28 factor (negative regulator of flagellin synthesis)
VGVLLASMDRSSNNSTCTSQTEDEENKPPFHEREKRSSKHHSQDSVEILPDLNEKAQNFVNPEETEEEQAKLAARRIWVEDSSFQEDMERVAEWLGAR